MYDHNFISRLELMNGCLLQKKDSGLLWKVQKQLA